MALEIGNWFPFALVRRFAATIPFRRYAVTLTGFGTIIFLFGALMLGLIAGNHAHEVESYTTRWLNYATISPTNDGVDSFIDDAMEWLSAEHMGFGSGFTDAHGRSVMDLLDETRRLLKPYIYTSQDSFEYKMVNMTARNTVASIHVNVSGYVFQHSPLFGWISWSTMLGIICFAAWTKLGGRLVIPTLWIERTHEAWEINDSRFVKNMDTFAFNGFRWFWLTFTFGCGVMTLICIWLIPLVSMGEKPDWFTTIGIIVFFGWLTFGLVNLPRIARSMPPEYDFPTDTAD